jgi:hypothetical protein
MSKATESLLENVLMFAAEYREASETVQWTRERFFNDDSRVHVAQKEQREALATFDASFRDYLLEHLKELHLIEEGEL